MQEHLVIIAGSGNAALCAGIAALEKGAKVLMVEKAVKDEAGGNSRYTAGAMRFVYNGTKDLLPLLSDPDDERLAKTVFGTFTKQQFTEDLLYFNGGRPLSLHQHILIDQSYDVMRWLGDHNVRFEPIYSRQSYKKNDQYIFWGGLTLAAEGEGAALVAAELAEFLRLGGEIIYGTEAISLITHNGQVTGLQCMTSDGTITLNAGAVILACGGFEANPELRKKYLGEKWAHALVRGSPHNTGNGIEMALNAGAAFHGLKEGCHATPMDLHMPDYGNLKIPYIERKNYRKICYFLGIMVNARGERFVDEGKNFRNYTYAQFGRAILEQPHHLAWQIFDSKVDHLLYGEYNFWDASYVMADTIEELIYKMDRVDRDKAFQTINEYNKAISEDVPFDPTILDGRGTKGLNPEKTNWATAIDTPPFKAYPVTCGITFTYGGLKVDKRAAVLREEDIPIEGLFACGELVGGVFYEGYPGGSGLTSGAVFGRIAGHSAAQIIDKTRSSK